jgi:hypothetical protein
MQKIVARHLAKLQRDLAEPARRERLRERLAAHAYPPAPPAGPVGSKGLRVVHQERIPGYAPDWYFEQELRRSGLWAMMENCYPTRQAQCQ